MYTNTPGDLGHAPRKVLKIKYQEIGFWGMGGGSFSTVTNEISLNIIMCVKVTALLQYLWKLYKNKNADTVLIN